MIFLRIILLFLAMTIVATAPVPFDFSECEKCTYIINLARRSESDWIACAGSYCNIVDIAKDKLFADLTAETLCEELEMCDDAVSSNMLPHDVMDF